MSTLFIFKACLQTNLKLALYLASTYFFSSKFQTFCLFLPLPNSLFFTTVTEFDYSCWLVTYSTGSSWISVRLTVQHGAIQSEGVSASISLFVSSSAFICLILLPYRCPFFHFCLASILGIYSFPPCYSIFKFILFEKTSKLRSGEKHLALPESGQSLLSKEVHVRKNNSLE